MADKLPLRAYQREAIDAVFEAWSDGMRRPAVVLPTGGGKTVIFSHLTSEYAARNKGQRAVILVHRDELADQALAKLKDVAPHLSSGKIKAEFNDVHAQVMVCSVQTLARERRLHDLLASQRLFGDIGLVITDECHHGAAPTYTKIYNALSSANHVGVTATLIRGDGVGLGNVWDDVVYTKPLMWMIQQGYLVQPSGVSVPVDSLDLSSVKRSRGDYQLGQLEDALQESGAMAVAAQAYADHGAGRPGVIFTPTVATAVDAAQELKARDIPTEVISGETPREERLRIFREYREGRIQVLANCMVLTEGWDAPWAEVAVIARPTQSQGLYIQMVGRVLRTWPGKTSALVLDIVGATTTNRLKTLVDLEPGMFPEKQPCMDCERIPCVCVCPECGKRRARCTCPKEQRELTWNAAPAGAVDLFAGSSSAWLRTAAGGWFIPAGDDMVVLWPEGEEMFSVAVAPKNPNEKWTKVHDSLPMGTAMAWAEAEAEERGGALGRKGARWRKNKATDKQVDYAHRLGITVPEGIRAGELGDLISIRIGTARLDRFIAPRLSA